jgi:hypothetical protein
MSFLLSADSVDLAMGQNCCCVCGRTDQLQWVYAVALILRDATGQLRATLTGHAASAFFGLPPGDLRRNNITRDLLQQRQEQMLSSGLFSN